MVTACGRTICPPERGITPDRSARNLTAAGKSFDQALDRATGLGSRWLASQAKALQEVNQDIYLSERDLADPNELPRRPCYRQNR